jgi:hypothetical protein
VPSNRRKGDIKVLVGATIAVLLLGGFIAGAAIVTTSGSKGVECGQLTVGLASDIRNNLDGGGPYFVTGGARCGFWLALQNGDIVAYKAIQPSGCTLKLRLDHWSCGSATVPVSSIARYPVSIQTLHSEDALIVNLGTPAPSSTTAPGS